MMLSYNIHVYSYPSYGVSRNGAIIHKTIVAAFKLGLFPINPSKMGTDITVITYKCIMNYDG